MGPARHPGRVRPFEARIVRRVRGSVLGAAEEDALAAEEPLEIRLNGRAVVVTMRTPGDDEELALGFLANEGVLRAGARPRRVRLLADPVFAPKGNIADVEADEGDVVRAPSERTFHATSACGVCGQASLETVERAFAPVTATLRVAASALEALPARMRKDQAVFDRTGGLHAAALFAPDGALLALREDVGRHNAVDKVTGWALLAGRLPLASAVLVVSGRAGFEVVQKAVASGIPVVAAVGAPSSLAADLAERAGVTLVGFLREGAFNVYAHAERVVA